MFFDSLTHKYPLVHLSTCTLTIIHFQAHIYAYIFSQEYKTTQVDITCPRHNKDLKIIRLQ